MILFSYNPPHFVIPSNKSDWKVNRRSAFCIELVYMACFVVVYYACVMADSLIYWHGEQMGWKSHAVKAIVSVVLYLCALFFTYIIPQLDGSYVNASFMYNNLLYVFFLIVKCSDLIRQKPLDNFMK